MDRPDPGGRMPASLKVLVCGDTGFIGAAVAAALRARGHVVRGLRRADGQGLDFAQATQAEAWRPWLAGMDAVVNAVGVLRDTAGRPLDAVHARAPAALFQACAEQGLQRVLHLSALGIADSHTRYAETKRAAEDALLDAQARGLLDPVLLRPSVVFGAGGASSRLFLGLARLPWLPLPCPALRTLMQPVLLADLAEAVVRLLAPGCPCRGPLDAVGPRRLTMAAFIAALRAQRGLQPARVIALGPRPSAWAAALGDALPLTPWGRETLDLMSQDNCGDLSPFSNVLGRMPRDPLTPGVC